MNSDPTTKVYANKTSEKIATYLGAKRQHIKDGTFQFKRLDGTKVTTAEVEINSQGEPVFYKNGKLLYRNLPLEMFKNTPSAQKARARYQYMVTEHKIEAKLKEVEELKKLSDKYLKLS